jgi:hypothetical protein
MRVLHLGQSGASVFRRDLGFSFGTIGGALETWWQTHAVDLLFPQELRVSSSDSSFRVTRISASTAARGCWRSRHRNTRRCSLSFWSSSRRARSPGAFRIVFANCQRRPLARLRNSVKAGCCLILQRLMAQLIAHAAARRGRVPWGVAFHNRRHLAHCRHCALFQTPH